MFNYINNNKIIFFFMLLISNIMILYSNYWLNMWIWLEVNLISFITIIINYKNYFSIESSLIYFLIQTIASIVMLYSMLISIFNEYIYLLISISLMIKMSVAPFHFWLPMMIEGMTWFNLFILLTWQKIGPMIMLFMYNYKIKYLYLFLIMSLIIGTIMGLNYSSLKKILLYSSINQMSWLILSLILFNSIFKIYLSFYFYLMFLIIFSLNYFKLNFINQMFKLKMFNKFNILFIFCNLLSLGGLPPFLGFFPKLMIIMNLNNSMMIMLMIMFTLISLFYYIRIIISLMILNSMKMNKLYNKLNLKKMNIMMKLSMLNNLTLIYLMFF